jgi:uncharacterized protein
MMTDYRNKSYGRNEEVKVILRLFQADRDIAMPGPRRLGKTFILERLVDFLPSQGWHAIKVEIAGLSDQKAVFRELCSKISQQRSIPKKSVAWIAQRMGQALAPRTDSGGQWYQSFLTLDHETYFERLVSALNDEKAHRWALLIDELPIFLKALHDKGPDGIAAALNFMNMINRLRVNYPKVRWLVTGSIGLEPLAQIGKYMGVLAKFDKFDVEPLTHEQAKDFIQDQAQRGALIHRKRISNAEADSLVSAVGWRAAYYLDAVAQKLSGEPTDDPAFAREAVELAIGKLIQAGEARTFGVWEEHLHKHYADAERTIAIVVINKLVKTPDGMVVDTLLATVNQSSVTRDALVRILMRMDAEGFVACDNWQDEAQFITIRNPLLRRWWQLRPPQMTL